jgi:hypothetical protein
MVHVLLTLNELLLQRSRPRGPLGLSLTTIKQKKLHRVPTPLFQSGSTCGGIHTEERKGRKNLFLFNHTTFKTAYQLLVLMSAKFLRSFFGDWYLQRFLSFVSV